MNSATSVYMTISACQFIPLTPLSLLLVPIHLLSISLSLFLFCKLDHLYHFSRFHVYAFVCNICFSLSDLIPSEWQPLGPSTSLQMIQFCSFLWLSNIPLYRCTASSLSIPLLMDIWVPDFALNFCFSISPYTYSSFWPHELHRGMRCGRWCWHLMSWCSVASTSSSLGGL